MPTSKKIFTVQNLTEKLKEAKGLVLFNYQGLDVAQMTELRQEVKKAGGEFEVVKNTLFRLAAKNGKLEGLPRDFAEGEILRGPTAALWIYEDNPAPLKAIYAFIKKNDLPEIKIGFWGENLLSSERVRELAELPGIETLRAQLIGTLQSPTYGLVNSLRWNIRRLIFSLQSLSTKP
jgi:large subunit ribosomal protein L10